MKFVNNLGIKLAALVIKVDEKWTAVRKKNQSVHLLNNPQEVNRSIRRS